MFFVEVYTELGFCQSCLQIYMCFLIYTELNDNFFDATSVEVSYYFTLFSLTVLLNVQWVRFTPLVLSNLRELNSCKIGNKVTN